MNRIKNKNWTKSKTGKQEKIYNQQLLQLNKQDLLQVVDSSDVIEYLQRHNPQLLLSIKDQKILINILQIGNTS